MPSDQEIEIVAGELLKLMCKEQPKFQPGKIGSYSRTFRDTWKLRGKHETPNERLTTYDKIRIAFCHKLLIRLN